MSTSPNVESEQTDTFGLSKIQDFGDTPKSVRETDHYQEEYVAGFVDKWDELIDWESRTEGEGGADAGRHWPHVHGRAR